MRYSFQILGLLALLCSGQRACAQSFLEGQLNFLYAFNPDPLIINQEEVENSKAWGAGGSLIYRFRFSETPVSALFRVGYRGLSLQGDFREAALSGYSHRMFIAGGGSYHFNDDWQSRLYLGMVNNRDEDDFRSQTTDNFKGVIQVEALYRIHSHWWLLVSYEHLLGPALGRYLILDPRYQLGLGVIYSWTWHKD